MLIWVSIYSLKFGPIGMEINGLLQNARQVWINSMQIRRSNKKGNSFKISQKREGSNYSSNKL